MSAVSFTETSSRRTSKSRPKTNRRVLDFGLAKAFGPELTGRTDSESPTLTRGGTETGVIMGTAAYMSPEQARGKTLDKRTDIWSFGCCLFEALSGRAVFLGETVSDTIAKILEREPDWKALPRNTPPRLKELLARCLTKDATHHLRDIGEARLALDGASRRATTLGLGLLFRPSAMDRRRPSSSRYDCRCSMAFARACKVSPDAGAPEPGAGHIGHRGRGLPELVAGCVAADKAIVQWVQVPPCQLPASGT